MKRISEYFVDLPDISPGDAETWFFLDELREAGKLDGLSSLLTRSRSKGGHVVLAFQDINGLRLVYGREGADELAGHCGNKVGLRVNDPTTGDWLAARMGKSEDWIESFTEGSSTSSQGISISRDRNLNLQERFFMPGYEFMNFGLTTPQRGLLACIVYPVLPYPGQQTSRRRLCRDSAVGHTDGRACPRERGPGLWPFSFDNASGLMTD